MNESRQEHLDSLRGIAALIVVGVHYLAAFYPYTVFGSQGHYQRHLALEELFFFPPLGLLTAGHFAVCLFFVLSGYVLSYGYLGVPNQKYKLLDAMVRRPVRLGGLVLPSIVVGFLLWRFELLQNYAVSQMSGSDPWLANAWIGEAEFLDFIRILTSSAFTEGERFNPPLWTIGIELYGSLMVYLFLLLFGGFRYRMLLVAAMIFLCRDSLYLGFWGGLAIADFHKGYNLNVNPKFRRIIQLALLALFVYFSSYPHYAKVGFLATTPYSFLPDDSGFGGGYPMLAAFLAFVLVISSVRLKRFLNRGVFLYLGKISYAVYVTHFLVMGSWSSWLFLLFHGTFGYHISFLLTLLLGLLSIVAISHVATKYIDEPSVRLARMVGHRAATSIGNISRYMQDTRQDAALRRNRAG